MTTLLDDLRAVIRRDKREARQRAHVAVCESKRRFYTKAAIRYIIRRSVSRAGNPNMRCYLCPTCGAYHIATSPK